MSTAMTQSNVELSDDTALVHAAKMGNCAAFEQLVNRHSALVFRVVRHIVPSAEDAEDVVQEAFLKAFEHLQQFEERARFSTWVTRIAFYAALSRIRHLQRFPLVAIPDDTDAIDVIEERLADWRPNPEQLYLNSELRQILQQALASLPEIYRVVFVLRDMENVSVADTAATLGLTIPNVKVRLLRARLQLRKQLSKYFDWQKESEHPGLGEKLLTRDPAESRIAADL
jgi:RNA polymerase sigma-70 factor (ECF subfamily)